MSVFDGKTILITGGTGSFGKAFLNTVLANVDFREVRIFSRDEWKQESMRIELGDPRVKFFLGDVRDRASVDMAMRGVDYVFHAAALKQVPSCEFFPMQAVLTNVVGSENVIDSACDNGVRSVVCLSTDKAVYPVNAMGMTKAMMEKVVQAKARNLSGEDTVLSCVRYGNVIASRGSVIPLFIKQIKQGQPLTLTVPEMTRFLLSLDDATQLVLFAMENADQGDIFIRKAPACTVEDLAQALANLFGVSPDIRIIGMRHGEKIYETLASREDLSHAEDMGGYFRVRMDTRDLNYNKYFLEGDADEAELDDYHSHNTQRLSILEVEELLRGIPEVASELEGWNPDMVGTTGQEGC
ncbi:MAG: polysaccharide biosynthesis protein [Gammaproteobacteria bacterium]